MQVWPYSEHADSPEIYVPFMFQVMSNELSTPRILICPTDMRLPASSFVSLSTSNVSYFVDLEARDDYPQMLLAGDRNLTTNGVPAGPGLVTIMDHAQLGWSDTMHNGSGNVVLADGSVHHVMGSGFGELTRRLVIP